MQQRGLKLTALSLALGFSAATTSAANLTPVTVTTTWYAQAEHGGLYAAKAAGIYEQHGLDVTIKMGGPQVNNVQLLMAGKTDFSMGYALQTLNAVKQDIPMVTVAAWFQKDPQTLIVHEGAGVDTLADLEGKGIRMPTAGRVAYWPWMKAEFGYSDDQLRPYDYSLGPFIADPEAVQQGYITNDGYFLDKAGVKGKSLLLADFGWGAYSCTLDVTQQLVDENPEVVKAMVAATAEGWAAYFKDPAPANALIKEDNPEMQDDLLAYSIAKLQDDNILLAGDAEGGKYGNMTEAHWKSFFEDMVKAETLPADLEWQKAFDLTFVKALYGAE